MEHRALQDLLAALNVEETSESRFEGPRLERNLPRVFGGLVLGQALVAASHTVPAEYLPHSCHAYFLRGGDSRWPISYEVESLHDGRSFQARNVRAWQGDRLLFTMSSSFHIVEQGLEWDGLSGPLPLLDDATPLADWCATSLVPLAGWWTEEGPFEIRFAQRPVGLVGGEPAEPRITMWIRPRADVPSDPVMTSALLGFASDLHLLGVTLVPHGRAWTGTRGVAGASIDHAMWFHRPFHWNDWLMCSEVSPISGGARGFSTCAFRNLSGALVASAAQEGLLRAVDGR